MLDSSLKHYPMWFEPFQGARATAKAYSPAPGILCTWVSGHADLQLVGYLIQQFERVANQLSPVETFHDWRGLRGYDQEAREAYSRWAEKNRKHFLKAHILVESPLVSMALSVARLKFDHLVPYT
ncbi:MAG: hypothetical protein N2515_09585, partial [Deltaproteobacteria bacterium]|nr:hypothetical protein [Deltaproteobacteria bacterium]